MRRDLYAAVSARIVAELERGAPPWVKRWSATSGANYAMQQCRADIQSTIGKRRDSNADHGDILGSAFWHGDRRIWHALDGELREADWVRSQWIAMGFRRPEINLGKTVQRAQ